MGKTFRGVFSLKNNELVRFRPGEERLSHDTETIKGLDNPELDQLFPMEMDSVREAIELVQGAGEPFSLEKFLAGEQSPVFFVPVSTTSVLRMCLRHSLTGLRSSAA